jgi:plasmid stabilization system protein ParE
MRVRWTTDATDDLERICDYIATSRPNAAQKVAASIVRRIGDLETFPQLGRHGRVEGTRELTFASLPFVAVYEVLTEEVHVLRILHGARRWPSG